jgi:hypothetical protein
MKNLSMRDLPHDIPAKCQDRVAPESAYLAEFKAATEKPETAMRQYVRGQSAEPKAATPAPSS